MDRLGLRFRLTSGLLVFLLGVGGLLLAKALSGWFDPFVYPLFGVLPYLFLLMALVGFFMIALRLALGSGAGKTTREATGGTGRSTYVVRRLGLVLALLLVIGTPIWAWTKLHTPQAEPKAPAGTSTAAADKTPAPAASPAPATAPVPTAAPASGAKAPGAAPTPAVTPAPSNTTAPTTSPAPAGRAAPAADQNPFSAQTVENGQVEVSVAVLQVTPKATLLGVHVVNHAKAAVALPPFITVTAKDGKAVQAPTSSQAGQVAAGASGTAGPFTVPFALENIKTVQFPFADSTGSAKTLTFTAP